MTADHDVNTLLHKEGRPFFLVFVWHWFQFLAPVCNEDQYITVFFGFLDHGGYIVFLEYVDHVFFAVAGTGVVGSVCIIQERNFNAVYFEDFNVICVFFGLVNSENRNIRITCLPEVQCLCHIIISVIIDVVGCRFNDIESCIDQRITDFCRSGERRISADCIMICGENCFLIDHGNVGCLNLIFYIFVDLIVIPCAGIRFTGFDQTVMEQVVTDSNNSCSGNFRSFCGSFGFFFLLRCFFCSLVSWFLDQVIVELMKNKNQKNHNHDGADQTDT